MRYDIAHDVRLTYSVPVWEHHVEVRLTPQDGPHQQVRSVQLTIEPACQPGSYRDCFGNRVHYCSVVAPHDSLTVRMRAQVGRQRKEILQLQRAGIPTASAEALLQRMLGKIDSLCAERDRLKSEQPHPAKGKALGGRRW